MKKVFGIVGMCLALLTAASLGCGGHKDTDKMDAKMGVSALAALADSHIRSFVSSMEALAETAEAESGNWEEMVGLLSRIGETQAPAALWFVLPDGSYFPGLMAGNTELGDLVISRSTGKKSLIAAVPVMRGGEVIGGLGASIFLDDLSRILVEELEMPDDMLFCATNEKGEVALHSNHELILVENPNLPKKAVFKTSSLTGWRFALGFKD